MSFHTYSAAAQLFSSPDEDNYRDVNSDCRLVDRVRKEMIHGKDLPSFAK
jgi:hypothetical protein